jgi:hypothetical protein
MSKSNSELDQEKLLLILEQLHTKMDEIIQINRIKLALLEERIKRLERSESTGDSL